MFLMFAGFAAYFLYDYKIGYPKKNLIHGHYQAFYEAGQLWKEEENQARWPVIFEAERIPFQYNGADMPLPSGEERDQPWPEILADTSRLESEGWEAMWRDFASERAGWPQHMELEEGAYTERKVDEQLWFAVFCGLLSVVALFFLVRTRSRFMKADSEAYYAPGGARIPYEDMVRVDKRKWESKGLAMIYYKGEGGEKKAKVDGMVYGQFKEEEGAPAEALFQKVMSHFSGEVIELLLPVEDAENPASDPTDAQSDDGNAGAADPDGR